MVATIARTVGRSGATKDDLEAVDGSPNRAVQRTSHSPGVRALIPLTAVAMLTAAGCSGGVSDSADPTSAPSSVSATSGDTTRTNNLYLEPVDDSVDISFTWTEGSYQITSDQASTWKGVTDCTPNPAEGNLCQLVVEAGRSASTEPAQWFARLAPVAIFTNGWSTSKTEPDELNFAISGTLTVNGTSYPVAIGQGSYVDSGTDNNNWWIGGSEWTNLGTVIVSPDRQFWITGGDNNEVFGIGSGVPPDSAPTPSVS